MHNLTYLMLCSRWQITLRPAYLMGVANTAADSLSRGKEVQEWCLHPTTAHRAFKLWGRPSWDLFASQATTLAPHFFTITRQDQGAQGMDALLQDWSSLRGPYMLSPLHN